MKSRIEPAWMRMLLMVLSPVAAFLTVWVLFNSTPGRKTPSNGASHRPVHHVARPPTSTSTVRSLGHRARPEAPVPKDAPVEVAAGAASLVRSDPRQAPAWAVPYGKEFWRQPAPSTVAQLKPSGTNDVSASLNVGEVVERVRHALGQEAEATGPQVVARTYGAVVGGKGLIFSPHRPGSKGARGASVPGGQDDSEADRDARASGDGPQADPAAQFTWHTLSVRQGHTVLCEVERTAPEWSYVGNTAQALLSARDALVEHYELRSDGAHVTWVLGRRPVALGPVTIEVAASGLAYAGKTDHGHHFADASRTARVRVGEATAVDTAGRTWPLTVEVQPSPLNPQFCTLRIPVPSAILTDAAYPLAIDPVIGPEFGMDNPIYGFSSSGEYPAVAWNGTDWLVVWSDLRAGNGYYDLCGTRVNANGAILDAAGLPISTAAGHQDLPAVAANGTNWLVVWRDIRNGRYSDIYGTRVSGSGVVLDPTGIAVSMVAITSQSIAVAANGTDWLVVWDDHPNQSLGSDIYGTRVSGSGVVLSPSGIPISTAVSDQVTPEVASDGIGWLVVWGDHRAGGDSRDIYGSRVNAQGTVLDSSGIAISTAARSQMNPSVAWNGTDWLVVWDDTRSGSDAPDIYGTRVGWNGVVLNSSGIPMCTATSAQRDPKVAASGTGWLVVWSDSRNGGINNIYGTRVDSSGVVVDASGIPIRTQAQSQSYPSVAGGETGWLVVWDDYRSGIHNEIYGARVGGNGAVVDDDSFAMATTQANRQISPAAAANGTDWLVVWADARDFNSRGFDLFGARVAGNGQVLDTSGMALSTAASDQLYPAVAANGTNWLVVWQDFRNSADNGGYYDLYGTRVSGSGVVLNPSGVAISTAAYSQWFPSVAANGTDWLVVWEDSRNSLSGDEDIYGARVNASGVVLNPSGIAISTAAGWQRSPAVAANGTNWLVVWDDDRNYSASGYDIYGARVDGRGVVLNPGGIAISTAVNSQVSPAVAANGTDWLAAWQDGRGSTDHIYGARVNPSGLVLNPTGVAISVATNSQGSPAIAAAGTNWLVVWQDARNVAATDWDIYAARVNPNGVLLDTTGFAVNAGTQAQQAPAVAALNGQYLVVYDGPAETGVRRIRANVISTPRPVLTLQHRGQSVVLTWTNAEFSLQSAPVVTGAYTNVPGATSPHTNPIIGGQRFFRLIGN